MIAPERAARLTTRRALSAVGWGVACLLMLPAGCSQKSKPVWTRGQAESLLRQALQAPLPDERRAAVQQVCASRFAGEPICIEAMAVIVRTDASMLVRRAAARGLATCGSRTAADALLAVIEPSPQGRHVSPPDAALRRDAVDALAGLAATGTLDENPELYIRPAAVLLRDDPDREVRMAAARLLGRWTHPQAVDALIEGIAQVDFGVSCTSHRALVEATGLTHERDADVWRAWRRGAAAAGSAADSSGASAPRTTAFPAAGEK